MARICFFSGDISRAGGTERVTTVIASELARRGHVVSILSASHGKKAVFPLDAGVRLASLNMDRHSANFSDLLLMWRLRRYMKAESLDYLVDVDVILSLYSLLASKGMPTKIISWEHFHYAINVGGAPQRFKRSLARRMAVRHAHAVVTLTEKDRKQYLKALHCKVPMRVINNPLTIAHERRSKLDAKVVLAAGRLVPQKGFDLLLRAWALAWSPAAEWRLRIVGSGPDEQALKELAAELRITEGVEFVPHANDMESQFLAASIYALSSRFEGFVLVLVEAKSFGLPSVSFDCDCGPSDIVRDGADGILVRPNDVEGFAAGLLELMNNKEKRLTFGERAYADDRFDLDATADQWERLLA